MLERINTHVVAPARERGLKCNGGDKAKLKNEVAPARERGLKLTNILTIS